MPDDGPARFIVESPSRMDHPRGWLLLGRFDRLDASVAGTAVTVASVDGVTVPARDVLALVEEALPRMSALLARSLPKLLIVRAPDPMWRGGLSGEDSLFMHGERPIRTPDRTSPYLHELFHVLAPFRPAADAHWVTEGLAEFYSIEIQRRIGRLTSADVTRALRLFARYGAWDVDFTQGRGSRVTNNSAPLVIFVLDGRIRAATAGAHGLDDAVGLLAREGGVVSTARFLGVIERVSGKSFSTFFRHHIYRGEQPELHLRDHPP
jgi:predicted metalloprotease with PDZ domain